MGMGAAPAGGGYAPLPRGFGNRPGDTTVPARGARWEDRRDGAACPRTRRGDEPNWRSRQAVSGPLDRRSAARDQKSPMSGAPRGVRMVAQSIRAASWLNGCGQIPRASRRSAAPHCFRAAARERKRGFGAPSFSGEAQRRPENLGPEEAPLRVSPRHEMLGASPSMTTSLLDVLHHAAISAPSCRNRLGQRRAMRASLRHTAPVSCGGCRFLSRILCPNPS